MVRFTHLAPLVCLVVLSCADMPTAPRAYVEFSGTILDRDGAAMAGARVFIESVEQHRAPDGFDGPDFSLTVITGFSGSFLVRIPEGRYRIYIQGAPGSGRPLVQLSHTLTAENARLNYRYSGRLVAGTLLGPDGSTLPGGLVYASPRVPGLPWVHASTTGSDYSLLLPPGPYRLTFHSGALGLPSVTLPFVVVANDTTIHVVLDGHPVSGVVFDPDGMPMPEVLVAATTGRGDEVYTFTKPDGTYAIRVPSGSYMIEVRPWAAVFVAGRAFGPYAIDGPRTLDFSLAGTEWTGFIRRADDLNPVPGAYVTAREYGSYFGAFTQADASGAFRLVVRPGGLYEILASSSSLPLSSDAVSAIAGADSTFDIFLRPAPTLAPRATMTSRAPSQGKSLLR